MTTQDLYGRNTVPFAAGDGRRTIYFHGNFTNQVTMFVVMVLTEYIIVRGANENMILCYFCAM